MARRGTRVMLSRDEGRSRRFFDGGCIGEPGGAGSTTGVMVCTTCRRCRCGLPCGRIPTLTATPAGPWSLHLPTRSKLVGSSLPDIYLPEFPKQTQWLNVPFIATGTLLGRSAPLIWFWDYCSLNSLRALPYVQEWHRRYADAGLRVIGVHSPQFEFGRDPALVEDAVRRLGIDFAVAL